MASGTAESRGRALLLIDFQHDFLADDGRLPVARHQVAAVVTATRVAILQARAAGDLIVRIGNEFRRTDFLRNALRHRAAIAGSGGTRWDPRLGADDSMYLAKWKGDAFCNPALHRVLIDHGVEQVALAGLYARGCVTATADGALARGLKVRALVDAIACRTDASRYAALSQLRARGVELVLSHTVDGSQT